MYTLTRTSTSLKLFPVSPAEGAAAPPRWPSPVRMLLRPNSPKLEKRTLKFTIKKCDKCFNSEQCWIIAWLKATFLSFKALNSQLQTRKPYLTTTLTHRKCKEKQKSPFHLYSSLMSCELMKWMRMTHGGSFDSHWTTVNVTRVGKATNTTRWWRWVCV